MTAQYSSSARIGSLTAFRRFEQFTVLLSKWLNWIAGAGLTAMLILVVADIVGIKAFAHPVPGGIEIVAFLGVVVIGFAIAYTQVLHGHIQVDFIVMRLPPRVKAVIDSITILLGMGFFVLLAWRSYDYARVLQNTGELSMTQRIPFYPFVFSLAFCFLVTFLVLTVDFTRAITKVGKR